MKDCWTRNWKKALVWACGYLSIIAFAVVGGYAIFKSDDAELKKATKKCFIVVLIFAAINAFQSLMNSILGMSSYNSGLSEFLRWFGYFENIAQIIIFAVFTLLALFGASRAVEQPKQDEAADPADPKSDAETKERAYVVTRIRPHTDVCGRSFMVFPYF